MQFFQNKYKAWKDFLGKLLNQLCRPVAYLAPVGDWKEDHLNELIRRTK